MVCQIDADDLIYDVDGNLIGEFKEDGFYDFEGNRIFCDSDTEGNAYNATLPEVIVFGTRINKSNNLLWIMLPIGILLIILSIIFFNHK